jgi:maltose-binding protein MalE
MKKIIIILLITLFSFAMIGCEGFDITDLSTFDITDLSTLDITDLTTEEITSQENLTTQIPTTETTQLPTSIDTESPSTEDWISDGIQLNIPTELTLDQETQVLSWVPVQGADAYEVYLFDSLSPQATVDQASYDISSLMTSSERLVFRVKAINDTQESSLFSNTIAYVPNETVEIAAIQLGLYDLDVPIEQRQAFATELVHKGMTLEIFNTMMSHMEDMNDVTDEKSALIAFDALMDSIDELMAEAFLSAFVKTLMMPMLEAEIDHLVSLHDQCAYTSYEGECLHYFDYADQIRELDVFVTYLNNHTDMAIKSMMISVNYMIEVQSLMDLNMIDDMDNILNMSGYQDFNVLLMLSTKNRFVDRMIESLPSMDEMVLLNTSLLSLVKVLNPSFDDTIDLISIRNLSQQTLLVSELILNLIRDIDVEEIDAFASAFSYYQTNDDLEYFYISILDFIVDFTDKNQGMIDDLLALGSSEITESLFNEIMLMIFVGEFENISRKQATEEDILAISEQINTIISYDQIISLLESLNLSFSQMIETLKDTDYLVLYAFFDYVSQTESDGRKNVITRDDDLGVDLNFYIKRTLGPGNYEVNVTTYRTGNYGLYIDKNGETFVVSEGYLESNQSDVYTFELEEETLVEIYTTGSLDTIGTLTHLDPISEHESLSIFLDELADYLWQLLADADIDSYETMIDVIVSMIEMELSVAELSGQYVEDYILILNELKIILLQTSEQQLNIMRDAIDVAAMGSYIQLLSHYHEMRYDDYFTYYAMGITIADMIVQTHDLIDEDLDIIFTALFSLMRNDDVTRKLLGLRIEDIDDLEDSIYSFIDSLYGQAKDIHMIDYQEITDAERQLVEDFILGMEAYGIYIEKPFVIDPITGQIKGYEPGVIRDEIIISVEYGFADFYQEQVDLYIEMYNQDENNPYLFPHEIYVQKSDLYDNLWLLESVSHRAPDILYMPEYFMADLVSSDLLAPIKSQTLIDQINAENHAFIIEYLNNNKIEDAYYAGVPYSLFTNVLLYNNLYLDEEDVQTWEGIWDIAKTNDVYASALFNETSVFNNHLIFAYNVSSGQPVTTMYEQGQLTNTSFVNDASISVTRWGQRFYSDANGMSNRSDWLYELINGEAMTVIAPAWAYTEAYMALGENLSVAPLPSFTLTEEDVYGDMVAGTMMKSNSFAPTNVLVMNKNSDHISYLEDILMYLSNQEMQEKLMIEFPFAPTYINALSEFDLEGFEVIRAQLEMLDRAISVPYYNRDVAQYYFQYDIYEIYYDLLQYQYNLSFEQMIEIMQIIENKWIYGPDYIEE